MVDKHPMRLSATGPKPHIDSASVVRGGRRLGELLAGKALNACATAADSAADRTCDAAGPYAEMIEVRDEQDDPLS